MATVFLARDEVLGRDVALKMMHEHLMNAPEIVRRFESEARTVASLSHENVIKVFDFGQIGTRPYLVMEYIEGTTLASLVNRCGTLPNLIALEVTRQIALGLSCTHDQGILHRDIKPDNIMIDPSGCVKIMDFGIAYLVNQESLTLTGSFVGSPRFISPEQAEAKSPITGKTDIFSLGVVIYLALCGTLPFDADTPIGAIQSIMRDTPQHACRRNPRVLFWLSDMVDTLLSKEPAVRPDARAVLALIDNECLAQGVGLGKERLLRFIADPVRAAADETSELFEHYRTVARTEAKQKRIAVALKKLEQAMAFGPLSPEDRKILSSYVRRRFIRKAAVAVGVGVIGISALALTIYGFSLYWKPIASVDIRKQDTASTRTTPAVFVAPMDSLHPLDCTARPIGNVAMKTSAPRGIKNKINESRDTLMTTESVKGAVPDTAKIGQPGYLSIKTNPPWAKVYIDDIERGTTPSTLTYKVSVGTHEVRLLKEGFAEYRTTISVTEQDTQTLRIHLSTAGN
jgi:hypothetical protein